MTINAPEVPNGGSPDPRVAPAPKDPDFRVRLGDVLTAVEEFAAAHPDLTADLAAALREAVVALEGKAV